MFIRADSWLAFRDHASEYSLFVIPGSGFLRPSTFVLHHFFHIDSDAGHRCNESRAKYESNRHMESGDQFRGRDEALVAFRCARPRKGDLPAIGSNVESVGCRETFRSEVDPGRSKLSDVFRAGGISAGQCRPRPGNVDVQGKIRNAGRDQRRGGIRASRRGATVKTWQVQSDPFKVARASRLARRRMGETATGLRA